jgi:hypothetical protein
MKLPECRERVVRPATAKHRKLGGDRFWKKAAMKLEL